MRVAKITALILAAISLNGCISPQEIAAQKAAEEDAKCRSYGLAFGTPGYAQCRMQLTQMQHQNALQQQAILAKGLSQHITDRQRAHLPAGVVAK